MIHPVVDIRDAGYAHYRAFITEGIHGQRFLIHKDSICHIELSRRLAQEFGKYGYPISTHPMTYEEVVAKMKAGAFILEFVLAQYDKPLYLSNEKSIRLLGMTYSRPSMDSALEEAYSLIKRGLVEDRISQKTK